MMSKCEYGKKKLLTETFSWSAVRKLKAGVTNDSFILNTNI